MRYAKFLNGIKLLAASFFAQAEGAGEPHREPTSTVVSFIPPAIQAEHQELHERLRQLTSAGGTTGSAAMTVEKLLAPHFVKEEQLALPPLGLLSDLAAGRSPHNSAAIIRMTNALKQAMPRMLEEHKQVAAALQRLQTAAETERNPEAIAFAKALAAHAALEEQVLYPSALLVGKYLSEKKK